MRPVAFDPHPINQLDSLPQPFCPEWIWEGYLARGNITLLTSRWKAGKTTLVAGLLRSLGTGGAFLGSNCTAASAIVVSEELPAHWSSRQRAIPIGSHTRLVSRPFYSRPTPEEWDELVRRAEAERERGALDVLVIDPLAPFLPGRSDSDPAALLDMINPLRRLAGTGVAVLILHHPRKRDSEEGCRARGSGALLGLVDVILEVDRPGTLPGDANRRKLVAVSRLPLKTPSLFFEWSPGTADFHVVPDLHAIRFQENWQKVESILAGRAKAATHKELLADWPADQPRPSERQLYEWLSRAVVENRVVRSGEGTRYQPYRFRLKGQEQYNPIGDPEFEAMLEQSVSEVAREAGRMIEAQKTAIIAQRGKPEPLICFEPGNVLSEPPESLKEVFNRGRPGSSQEKDKKDEGDEGDEKDDEDDDDDLDDFPPSMRRSGPWAR
jgi:hypothetical protein